MGCLGSKGFNENENEKNEKNSENDKNNNKKEKNKETKDKKKSEKKNDNDGNNDSNDVNNEITSENKKLDLQMQNYNGVILMKGVEECIPENLKENEIHNLVKQALSGNVEYNKITEEQAKAISSILYKKIHKKGSINMKDYPELEGVNIKVGSEKLTKELIRRMMFNNNQEIDEYQIDLTYSNLTKNNDDIKVLSIELLDD